MNEMKTASAKPKVYVFNGADLIEFHKSSYRTCHEFGTVIDAPELIVDMVVRERRPQPPAAGWLRVFVVAGWCLSRSPGIAGSMTDVLIAAALTGSCYLRTVSENQYDGE
jgi:hypothetical protein